MTLRVVPLGTNGYIPALGRHTASYLLLTPVQAILLDAGTGIARLLEQPLIDLLAPYDCLNVILSHYHLDHIVGLSYLAGTWTRGTLRIYAPGRPLVDAEPEDALNRLLSPPLFPQRLAEFPAATEVIPLTTLSLTIGGLAIALRVQTHPGGSLGMRIGDSLAYVTDTIVDDATADFVRGVRLLLHEVWLTDAEAHLDEPERGRHSYVSGVAQIAQRAAVGELMPIHHKPTRSREEIAEMARELHALAGVSVTVAQEGRVYPLA